MIEFPLIKIARYPKGAERGAAVPLSAPRVGKKILQHATTGPLIMLGRKPLKTY